jgi:hypothetical protein
MKNYLKSTCNHTAKHTLSHKATHAQSASVPVGYKGQTTLILPPKLVTPFSLQKVDFESVSFNFSGLISFSVY